MISPSSVQDVMLICRNGHVITDALDTYPDRALAHCDRCGAATLDRCQTCGQRFLGATIVPGMTTLGTRRAPDCCVFCGAALPWSQQPGISPPFAQWTVLENLLRRLPLGIRHLRTRHADRPPFKVQDEHDLEDLMWAVLPLQFDSVRQESRTPRYAPCTRIDFRLGDDQGGFPMALTTKLMNPRVTQEHLWEQWAEDIAYYDKSRGWETLVAFIYDPEGLIREPREHELIWGKGGQDGQLHCVIGT